MNTTKIKEKYVYYGLEPEDVFKHQHYVILTRSAIEKIQAQENIDFDFEVIKSEPNFASVKGWATKEDKTIRTTGSAKKGDSFKDGSTTSWYVLEMAEKRCFARAILKLLGLYEIGFKSEDESEEFKKK